MVSKALVTKIIDENRAEVQVQRQSACGDNCGTCSGCDKPSFTATVIAKNTKNAQIGDMVNVSSDTSFVLKGAAYVYVSPVVLFFIAYNLVSKVSEGELFPSIAGIFAFAVGIYGAFLYSKRISKKENFEII